MTFTENTKVGDLLSNGAAAKVLEKHLPGISTNPMIGMAKSFTLKQLAGFPQANIPSGKLEEIVADLLGVKGDSSPYEVSSSLDSKGEGRYTSTTDMKNVVAVVTGAGSGIGRASSLKLAAAGAKIVAVDFNPTTGEETLALIREQGGEGIFIPADVSKEEDVKRYVHLAVETYGRIDVFFNNAGVLQKFSKLADIEATEYDRVMNVNVKGVFLGLKHVLRVMEKQGAGSIINTASTAGIRSEHSTSVYSASKHAVVGLTKAAAIEYVKNGIRINAICPGGVDTALTQAVPTMLQENGYEPEEFPNMRMGRFSSPGEIAEMVLFLASDRASYMTGSIIAVDGGLTL